MSKFHKINLGEITTSPGWPPPAPLEEAAGASPVAPWLPCAGAARGLMGDSGDSGNGGIPTKWDSSLGSSGVGAGMPEGVVAGNWFMRKSTN